MRALFALNVICINMLLLRQRKLIKVKSCDEFSENSLINENKESITNVLLVFC